MRTTGFYPAAARHLLGALRILVPLALLGLTAGAQTSNNGEVRTLKVQGNVYILVGAGGNITVQTGNQDVLLVDAGVASMSERVVAAVRQLSNKPIRYIVDTAFDADHTGGNENLAKAGRMVTGGNVVGSLGSNVVSAPILAHENVLNRMSAPTGRQSPTPGGAWPTDTYVHGQKELYYNDEPIQIMYQPAAHTDGDSMVFFRKSDVLSTGDVFVTTSYPVIDLPHGGSVQGVIEGLNRILDIAIPRHEQEGGTMIIPGHGRVCDEADVVEYRDMVTIIRDRVRASIKKGMSLEQVKAAGLTRDYDARYGASTGTWTTDMFVEAVYRSLTPKK